MSLRRRLLLAYLVPLLVTLASSVVVQRAFRASVTSQRDVLESNQIMSTTQHLLLLVIDAETGLRGFLLSGLDSFLTPYTHASEAISTSGAQLEALVANDPAQVARVRRIVSVFQEWREVVAEPQIASRRGGASLETVARRVAEGQGKQRTDVVRRAGSELIAVEQARLLERSRANEGVTRQAALLALLAPLIATAIALFIGLALARRIVRSVESVASAAEAIAAGRLSQRAGVRGTDEIARMATAFNTMGEWLVARTQEMDGLQRLGEMLHACNDPDEAYRIAATLAPQLFPAMSGVVWSMHKSHSHLSPVAAWGALDVATWGPPFPPDECWALRGGKAYLVEQHGIQIRCPHTPATAPAATLCVPLVAHGEILGVVQLGSAQGVIAEATQSLAEAACEQLALALSNLRLRDDLRQQSIRDALTGLFNRRYLEETLQRELARALRAGGKVGVLMVDVDHFKRLNDTEGHDAGDAVLRKLGETLAATFRASDIACRYGGEEFVVVLPDIKLPDLPARAELLRENVQRMTVLVSGKMLGTVSVSIGAAVFPEHGDSAAGLLHNADQALYRAKREGRNRVVLAGDAVPTRG